MDPKSPKHDDSFDELLDAVNSLTLRVENKIKRKEEQEEHDLQDLYEDNLHRQLIILQRKMYQTTHRERPKMRSRGKIAEEDWQRIKQEIEAQTSSEMKIKAAAISQIKMVRSQISVQVDEITKHVDFVLSLLQPYADDMDYFFPGVCFQLEEQLTSVQNKSELVKIATNPSASDLKKFELLRKAVIVSHKHADQYILAVHEEKRKLMEQQLADQERAKLEEQQLAEKRVKEEERALANQKALAELVEQDELRQKEKRTVDESKSPPVKQPAATPTFQGQSSLQDPRQPAATPTFQGQSSLQDPRQPAATPTFQGQSSLQDPRQPAATPTFQGQSSLQGPRQLAAISLFHGTSSLQESRQIMSDFERKLDQFRADPKNKQFSFNVKKVVSSMCSQISGNDLRAQGRFQLFVQFLEGKPTRVPGGSEVISLGHPEAVDLAWGCLFQSIIAQGEAQFSETRENLLPFAAVMVRLIGQFSRYQMLFFAFLFSRCPMLAPFFPNSTSGENLFSQLGFRPAPAGKDGEDSWESSDRFLSRCQGLSRLYAAMMVVRPAEGHRKPDEFSVARLWSLLAHLLNSPTIEGITSQIIKSVLELGYITLQKNYKHQFQKLLQSVIQKFSQEKDVPSISLVVFVEGIL